MCELRLFAKVAVLAFAMVAALALPAVATQLVTWESLAPSAEPYDDPFAEIRPEQRRDLRHILRANTAARNDQLYLELEQAADKARTRLEEAGLDADWLLEQRLLVMERRQQDMTGVTSTHLDSRVSMDGYALPMRLERGRVVEFMLVPWVGACIHTPAPAANQIVHVDFREGFEAVSMFTPIRLTGRLLHRPAEFNLFFVDGSRRIQTSYAIDQAVIGGAPGKIVAASVQDLGPFARAQIWTSTIFTAGMTAVGQDSSAKALLLALALAFAYGALHTLGPGHGKAVVISYFVGSGGSLWRGLAMGVRIAVIHVLSAVVVVFVLDLAVRQATGAAPSDYRAIRLASYALIMAIGAFLLWQAVASLRARGFGPDQGAGTHKHHDHAHRHAGCAACAASQTASGSGWIALAVGIVPCTGALLIMLFGLANDLIFPAIMMVVAISAGMALAMSALGLAAIWARGWAERRFAPDAKQRHTFENGARLVGATCVLAIGALLFLITLSHDPSVGNSTTEIVMRTEAVSEE